MLFQLTQQAAEEKHWKLRIELNWRQIGPTFPKNIVGMIRDSQTVVTLEDYRPPKIRAPHAGANARLCGA